MRNFAFFLFCIAFVQACNFSEFQGYKKVDSGLHFKLISLGDRNYAPQDGDLVRFRITISNPYGHKLYPSDYSVALDSPDLVFKSNYKGGLYEALSLMNEGDSAHFILDRKMLMLENIPYIIAIEDTSSKWHFQIQVYRILTPTELQEELERMRWRLDSEMNEHILLEDFLKYNQVGKEYFHDGIYILPVTEGKGKLPKSGDVLKVHYKAYFIDNTQLDDTYYLNRPLEIVLGKPGQLLNGFDMGLRTMKKGGKSIFIMPSQFAFGERGASNGSVPPFTTVIYETELLSIE